MVVAPGLQVHDGRLAARRRALSSCASVTSPWRYSASRPPAPRRSATIGSGSVPPRIGRAAAVANRSTPRRVRVRLPPPEPQQGQRRGRPAAEVRPLLHGGDGDGLGGRATVALVTNPQAWSMSRSKTRKKVEWLFRRAEGALLPEAVLSPRGGSHLDWPDALRAPGRRARGRRRARPRGPLRRADARHRERRHEPDMTTLRRAARRRRRPPLPRGLGYAHLLHERRDVPAPRQQRLPAARGGQPHPLRLRLGRARARGATSRSASPSCAARSTRTPATRPSTGASSRTRTSTTSAAPTSSRRRRARRLAVHELDARVLSCFTERIVIASKDCDVFWRRAGVPDAERATLLEMYSVRQERLPRAGGGPGAARRRHDRPRLQGAPRARVTARG